MAPFQGLSLVQPGKKVNGMVLFSNTITPVEYRLSPKINKALTSHVAGEKM
jgi:hypothetical protein